MAETAPQIMTETGGLFPPVSITLFCLQMPFWTGLNPVHASFWMTDTFLDGDGDRGGLFPPVSIMEQVECITLIYASNETCGTGHKPRKSKNPALGEV